MKKKDLWYFNEDLVCKYYLNLWFFLIKKNYTIRWWEIDLILQKWQDLVLVEVKTVNYIEELDNYIKKSKIYYLQRTLEAFFMSNNDIIYDSVRIDVVFVKNWEIIDIFEDITWN